MPTSAWHWINNTNKLSLEINDSRSNKYRAVLQKWNNQSTSCGNDSSSRKHRKPKIIVILQGWKVEVGK